MPRNYEALSYLSMPIGVAGGILAGVGTRHVAKNLVNQEVYKANKTTSDIFRDLHDLDCDYDSGGSCRSGKYFIGLPPSDALQRLNEMRTVVENNEDHLAKVGYLEKTTNLMNSATIAVERWIPQWPDDSANWYAYLYSGSNASYIGAKELTSLFDHIDNTRTEAIGRTESIDISTFFGVGGSAIVVATLLCVGSYFLLRKLGKYLNLRLLQRNHEKKFASLEKL